MLITGRRHLTSTILLAASLPIGFPPPTRQVLHEMAHASAVNGLGEDRKLASQELRGRTYRLGHDEVSWCDPGGEQAAEIMAWE